MPGRNDSNAAESAAEPRIDWAESDPAMEAFRMLLRHESSEVQLWVASVLLADGDDDARTILTQLAGRPGITGFSASMVLDEHSAGRFTSPFPDSADE